MYAKLGLVEDAQKVFERAKRRDLVSYNTMMNAYVTSEKGHEALALFRQLIHDGSTTFLKPDHMTFTIALKACALVGEAEWVTKIHKMLDEGKIKKDVVIVTALLDAYSKLGNIKAAKKIFQEEQEHCQNNVVFWTAIILALARGDSMEHAREALRLFHRMVKERKAQPNNHTFTAAITACVTLNSLEEGNRVHRLVVDHLGERGLQRETVVVNALIDMFSKCVGMWVQPATSSTAWRQSLGTL